MVRGFFFVAFKNCFIFVASYEDKEQCWGATPERSRRNDGRRLTVA